MPKAGLCHRQRVRQEGCDFRLTGDAPGRNDFFIHHQPRCRHYVVLHNVWILGHLDDFRFQTLPRDCLGRGHPNLPAVDLVAEKFVSSVSPAVGQGPVAEFCGGLRFLFHRACHLAGAHTARGRV
jgi:hypothetical protein